MNIPTRKIEDRAIGAINCLIDQHPTMDSHIQKGDKDLSWDGYIRIFKNDDCIKDKINYLGDIPVQVKGHIDKERKYMDKTRIKYLVDVRDMWNYYKQNGCLYFQIFMSEDGLERVIFYCSLYTSRLKEYLEEVGNKEEGDFSIPFTRLKPDYRGFAALLAQFHYEATMLGSGLGQIVPRMIPSSQIGSVTHITATTYGGHTPDDLMRGLKRGDVVPYTPLQNTDIQVPVQMPKDWIASIKNHMEDPVRAGDEIFYSGFEFEKVYSSMSDEDGCDKVVITPSQNIALTFHDTGLNIRFDLNSDVITLKKDAEFLLTLSQRKHLSFGDMNFPVPGIVFQTEYVRSLHEIIAMGTVSEEIKLYDNTPYNKLDEKDVDALYELCLIKENKKQIPHTSESYTYHWKYKGKDYPVIIAKESKGKYKVFSLLYEKLMKICLGSENKSDPNFIPPSDDNLIPSFIFLTGETLANLYYYNYETIFEQIEKSAVNKVTDEPLNNLALEFIRAYDICADQQLLEAAKLILRRLLLVFPSATHCLVNLWQIEYRENDGLSSESRASASQLLSETGQRTENDDEDYYRSMYFCLLVLLDEKEKAKNFLDIQSNELKDAIMKWPIYSFYLEKQKS